jgi:hypothetical protein
MSIIITNIGGNQIGVCRYRLSINTRVITEFEHDRTKGLAVCLRKAADAIDKSNWERAKQIIEQAQRDANNTE